MNRQHVNLVDTHEPVDDAVGRMDHLANLRILEFWNRPTRLRKRCQPVRRAMMTDA